MVTSYSQDDKRSGHLSWTGLHYKANCERIHPEVDKKGDAIHESEVKTGDA
jgi:hypothetical protein